jgi:hypothetical protein
MQTAKYFISQVKTAWKIDFPSGKLHFLIYVLLPSDPPKRRDQGDRCGTAGRNNNLNLVSMRYRIPNSLFGFVVTNTTIFPLPISRECCVDHGGASLKKPLRHI